MPHLIHDNRTVFNGTESQGIIAEPNIATPYYKVHFVNATVSAGIAYMYQTDPALANLEGSVPLVWFCHDSRPDATVLFAWSAQYCMFWSSANLAPDTVVEPAQILPCGLRVNNEAMFTGKLLTNQATGSPFGSLIISQAGSVPATGALLGIGMSGAGTFAFPACPNITAIIHQPNPRYWIAFSPQTARRDIPCDSGIIQQSPSHRHKPTRQCMPPIQHLPYACAAHGAELGGHYSPEDSVLSKAAPIQQGSVLVTTPLDSVEISFPQDKPVCSARLNLDHTWSLSYSHGN